MSTDGSSTRAQAAAEARAPEVRAGAGRRGSCPVSCQNFVRDDRTTIDFTQSEQPGGLSSEQPGQEMVETDDYRAHEAASAGKIQASLRETARANRDTDGAPPCTRHALGSPPGRGRLSRHRVRGARPTAVGDPRCYITRESVEPASTRDAPASHSRRRAPSCPWRRFERARLTLAMRATACRRSHSQATSRALLAAGHAAPVLTLRQLAELL